MDGNNIPIREGLRYLPPSSQLRAPILAAREKVPKLEPQESEKTLKSDLASFSSPDSSNPEIELTGTVLGVHLK